MPILSERLEIKKPLGNETVSRAAFNENYDIIDANAATRKEPEILAQDIYASGFVLSGMESSKNATIANQLDVTAGACYTIQSDGGLRRFTPTAASFTTSVVSTMYYLDFQPDGTYSWDTAHSTQANYLPVAEVMTDAAGDISTVTDKRTLTPGEGKVNADLVRSRNLAAEHDTHQADTTTVHGATSSATASKIVIRDTAGRAKVAAPSAVDDIARKDTVDAVQTNLATHQAENANPHNVTKAQVGLGGVEDLTATQIREATDRGLRAEVIGSYPAHAQGKVIFHTGEGKFRGSTGTEWL